MVKYIEDKFDEEFIETLGLNVMEKSFELKNCIANLQIYHLGGQRQFAELMPTALEGTKAVIFAFNLIQKQSLNSIKRWYKDARKLTKVFKPILVGTNYDLFEQKDSPYKAEICKMPRDMIKMMKLYPTGQKLCFFFLDYNISFNNEIYIQYYNQAQ